MWFSLFWFLAWCGRLLPVYKVRVCSLTDATASQYALKDVVIPTPGFSVLLPPLLGEWVSQRGVLPGIADDQSGPPGSAEDTYRQVAASLGVRLEQFFEKSG